MAVCGITARNEGQKKLIKSILDKNIDLTIVNGALGSGKTLVVTACAVELLNRFKVDRIVVTRPMVPDQNEAIGHLPGTEEQKLDPYLGGFHCAALEIDELTGFRHEVQKTFNPEIPPFGSVITKSLATIKGCSYSNSIMILDEAQDATLSQLKKFIGRAGRNTKVIVMGDLKQKSNKNMVGFDLLIAEAEKGTHDFINLIKLTEVERSRLADFADKLGD